MMKYWFVLLVALVVLAPANGQDPNQVPSNKKLNEFRVIQLKFLDAALAMEAIETLDLEIRATVDHRTNSLLVCASEGDMEVLTALMVRIDRELPKQDTRRQTKLFRIQGKASSILNSLTPLLVGKDSVVTVNEPSNVIVASASIDELKSIEALIQALDEPLPVAKPIQLRIIWLSSDAKEKPTDDRLLSVLESLERVGIRNLGKKSQVLINVSEANGKFSVTGSVDDSMSMHVSGHRQGDTLLPARLDLSIEVVSGQKQPIDMKAVVTVSPKQMVVLGSTPSSTNQSVFVVELIEGI